MSRILWICVGVTLTAVISVQVARPQQVATSAPTPASDYRPVLNRYCVTCHSEKLKTAGLVLETMDLANVPAGAETWEKVIKKVRTGAMPPPGMPRPDKAFYDSFPVYLETAIDRAAAANPNPGRPNVHRLNRAEYANAVRDLFAVDIDGRSLLPADDSGYGFDNIGDVLSVSPVLMERYMSAAEKVSRMAVGDPDVAVTSETYTLSKLAKQDDRESEDLPFESRGGGAIRHNFPSDGEYAVKILLRRSRSNFISGLNEGLGEPHQLEVRLDGTRLKEFSVGGERRGKKRTVANAIDGYSYEMDPEIRQYETSADSGLETRFSAKAGTRVVGVSFVREQKAEDVLQPLEPRGLFDHGYLYKFGDPEVASVTITGPYSAKGPGDTPSRQKIFVCRPASPKEEEPCARKILANLTRRAYRRPLMADDVEALLTVYKAARATGGFEAGIGVALQAMLVSPDFLFRAESEPAGAAKIPSTSAYLISDLDLASRLSFFLWSSIPDDELLDAATRGKLHQPEVLEQQVRRMLGDPRSNSLVTNFAGQWLYLRNMATVIPDERAFPDFDDNLRDAFQQETDLFFESNLREDHSVLDLLNADYTFLNERLAKHYGIPNIYGNHFRRVTLTDENRRGLLGQGSLLTVTSYATRTSVVLRGKWLLENVLGTPPPPPPPDVPSLKDRNADGKILSVRQQMEQHRASPVCASCHSRMDPLGFALENFDGIGKWRTTEGASNTPIDTSAALPDGTKFNGPAELRKILLSHPEQFATTVTEKLMTYALGRGVEYYDAPAIRKIVQDAAPGGYRWSSLILGIARSTPFQMRKPLERASTVARQTQ